VERLEWLGDRCQHCHVNDERRRPGTAWEGILHQFDIRPTVLAFSPDGHLLGAAGHGPFVDVYDLTKASPPRRLPIGPGPTRILAFLTLDRTLVGVSCDDRLLRFLDLATAEVVFSLPVSGTLREVLVSPNHDLILTVGKKNVEFWTRVGKGHDWGLQRDLSDVPEAVSIAPDGSWVALASGATVEVWNYSENRWRIHWMYRDSVSPYVSVTFPRGKKTLIAVRSSSPSNHRGKERWVTCWDLDRSTPKDQVRCVSTGKSPVLTPDGAWIASIDDWGLHFESADSEHRGLRVAGDPRTPIQSIRFSPCGQLLATIDDAARLKLWPWKWLVSN
jgi:WD40 repeat protein